MKSVYIHIPFCEHICYYCDFNKVFLEGQPVDEYIQAVVKEIQLTKKISPSSQVETIYIGGGTPTSLSANQLDTLLNGIVNEFSFSESIEFTVEANPGDLTLDKLTVMQNHGVNRLSMGVQAFDDRLLKKIGRKHTVKDVYDTMKLIELVGFQNVSIDLIFSLPNQTIEMFEETLNQALSLNLPHYSIYSLILENKTIFYNWARQGKLHLPGNDAESDMFELAIEKMNQAGLLQYEVSNFCLPGMESKHNLVYWNNDHYYGIGAGASGYIGNMRYKNHGPIQHYLKPLKENQLPVITKEYLTRQNQMEEEMFLGLRKTMGVSKNRFKEKFDCSIESIYGETIESLIRQEMLVESETHLSLTEKGLILGNDVFETFLLD